MLNMTSRELRNQRREAERKAKKLEYRQSRLAVSAPEVEFTPNPELLDEFTAGEQAEMAALRARVHARANRATLGRFSAGLPDVPHSSAASGSKADPLVRMPVPRPASEAPDEPAVLACEARLLQHLSEAKTQERSGPTGPRTLTGKATSSGNSLKHGLASGRIIIPGEDPADFEALLSDLVAEHAPANETEALLVQHMAQSWWLMQRAIRIQNQAFTETGVDTQKLALLMRYQTTHERAFYKALNSMIKLVKERRKFVSQKRAQVTHPSHFVSQKTRVSPPKPEFVSQNAAVLPSADPEAGIISPPQYQAA
jgi:hypothetical protein